MKKGMKQVILYCINSSIFCFIFPWLTKCITDFLLFYLISGKSFHQISTGVRVTASLLRSPEFFRVFYSLLTMLRTIWSAFSFPVLLVSELLGLFIVRQLLLVSPSCLTVFLFFLKLSKNLFIFLLSIIFSLCNLMEQENVRVDSPFFFIQVN